MEDLGFRLGVVECCVTFRALLGGLCCQPVACRQSQEGREPLLPSKHLHRGNFSLQVSEAPVQRVTLLT